MGEDVAEVDGVGRHEHARAEAGQVVGLDLGQVQACLDDLGEEKRVLDGSLNGAECEVRKIGIIVMNVLKNLLVKTAKLEGSLNGAACKVRKVIVIEMNVAY